MYKIIEQTYLIDAPKEAVWQALTNKDHIEKWSGTEAVMDDVEGTEFKLWDGDIHGKNIEIQENEELIQEWFGGNWEKASRVTITLSEVEDKTKVRLLHEDVPESEVDAISDGWKEYYFEPLAEYVENEMV